jgi:hypothetical protein
VGQDLARAGLEGRHRVPTQGRPAAVPREARLQPRRLRLHDLHRQLRPAARRDRRGDQRQEPRRVRGALRQPQLRGAHPPRRARELPRVAAARRRLRARRHGWTSTFRTEPLGTASDGKPTSTCATSGRPATRSRRDRSAMTRPRCSASAVRDVFAGDERCGELPAPGGRLFAGARVDLHRQAAVLRGHDATSPPRRPTSAARACSACSATRHHRPHLAGRLDQADSPGGQVPDRARRRAADFNSYGARRGNHEVMMRGTFANIRIKNCWCPAPRAA